MRNRFYTAIIAFVLGLLITSCGTHSPSQSHYTEIDGLTFTEREQLSYAEGFSIDRYEGGYSLIATNGGKFLVVPEGKDAPKGLNSDITVLKQPLNNIYLAATADMTFFDKLGALGAIRFSSVKESDWYIDNAKAAMGNGDIVYAGKYREPDYELLLGGGCTFSIQSTMIDHTPEVKEKLEELGVTVFTDYSSYEGHPLGRSEWVKVYGEITGKAEKAAELFKEQEQKLSEINSASVKKSVAFFYINNAGQISVRKSDDYISKILELAGGENVFKNVAQQGASASFPIDAEQFYALAKDADLLIYNTSLGGIPANIDELIKKCTPLADFKAVQEKNIWCTSGSLFQETLASGAIIQDFHKAFYGGGDTKYVTRLKDGEAVE